MDFLKELYENLDNQDTNVKLLLIKKLFSIGKFFGNGSSKDKHIEAEKYLIEQIKQDDKMPIIAKAAMISNSSRIIKEYSNQNDIVNMALEQLNDNASPNKIDNEWLSYFFEQSKNVEAQDIKIIWAKILAKECENNNSIPKKLLSILSCISNEEAKIFCNLSKLAFYYYDNGKKDWHIFYDLNNKDFYSNHGMYDNDLIFLEEAGLIQFSMNGYNCCYQNEIEMESIDIHYHEKLFRLYPFDKRTFKSGNVELTGSGSALIELISIEKLDNFYDNFLNFLQESGSVEKL